MDGSLSSAFDTNTQIDEIEARLERIRTHKGVEAVMVFNEDNLPLRSNIDGTRTMMYANLCKPLEIMARKTIKDIDPTNDLVVMRIRTNKHELIISPEQKYLLTVIQSRTEKSE